MLARGPNGFERGQPGDRRPGRRARPDCRPRPEPRRALRDRRRQRAWGGGGDSARSGAGSNLADRAASGQRGPAEGALRDRIRRACDRGGGRKGGRHRAAAPGSGSLGADTGRLPHPATGGLEPRPGLGRVRGGARPLARLAARRRRDPRQGRPAQDRRRGRGRRRLARRGEHAGGGRHGRVLGRTSPTRSGSAPSSSGSSARSSRASARGGSSSSVTVRGTSASVGGTPPTRALGSGAISSSWPTPWSRQPRRRCPT